MRIMVVGAGAVGQAYGAALQRGGASVIYLVRERHLDRVRKGFRHFHIQQRKWVDVPPPTDVVTDPGSVHVDLSLWTLPTDALTPEWLDHFLAAQGERPIVMLQPGLNARQLVLDRKADARITQGLITLVAYEGPLPGETRHTEPGLVLWFPPFAKAPLEGPDAQAVVERLVAGGFPARVGTGVDEQGAFGSMTLAPLIGALRVGGWRFATLDRRLAVGAMGEALAVAEAVRGGSRPFGTRLLSPFVLGLVTRLVPWVFPFDIEVYLESHFTKVGEQTREHLSMALFEAKERGLPHAHLERLMSSPTWG